MWWRRLLDSFRLLFRRRSSEDDSKPRDAIDALRIARHAKLRTALPFPELYWTSGKNTATSLAKLHDYAVQLANGALDWYLEKKSSKKRVAVFLHWWTYSFGVLAAVIPLLMLNFGKFLDPIVKQHLGIDTNLSSVAAEAALLIAAIAGGATLIDRAAGFTADWMRYITTAVRINRALIEFQFEWSTLERNSPFTPKENGDAAPVYRPPAKGKIVDPVEQRIVLATQFCMEILDFMDQETSVWADELRERVAQMARQFHSHRP
jgi:conflict system pore-forming effector with SLATT domain